MLACQRHELLHFVRHGYVVHGEHRLAGSLKLFERRDRLALYLEWVVLVAIAEDGRETVLRGTIDGHEALRHMLRRIDRLGLPIISAARSDPDLEEVFMRINGSRSPVHSPKASRSASP